MCVCVCVCVCVCKSGTERSKDLRVGALVGAPLSWGGGVVGLSGDRGGG